MRCFAPLTQNGSKRSSNGTGGFAVSERHLSRAKAYKEAAAYKL
jgi:hypothetical protein